MAKFNLKVEPAKLLKVGAIVVGLAGTLLANAVAANDQQKMKDDLKKELLDELAAKKN